MDRTHSLSLVALLAGGLTTLAALPAQAALFGGWKPPPVLSLCTSEPSPSDCRDPLYWKTYCSAIKRDSCNATLTADYLAQRGGLTQSSDVVVPDGLPGAGGHETVPVKPYDRNKDSISGYWATYSGRTLSRRAAAKSVWDLISPGQAKRNAWAANGARVTSCEEYVFERYQSWSAFEDTTGEMGRNWAAIYDEAMKDGSAIAGGVIRSITGVHVWDIKWDTTTPGPKSELFAELSWDGTSATVGQVAGWKYEFDPRIKTWLANGRSWRKPSWENLRFWGYIAAFGRTADDYDQLARKKRDYKDLWAQRRAIVPSFMTCLGHYGAPDMGSYCPMVTTSIVDLQNDYQWRAYVLDYQIERTLLEADELGCMATDHTTWCDWSAQEWIDQIRDQVRAQQEKSFQRCLRFTGDDFSDSGLVAFTKRSGLPDIGQPAYNATGLAVDDIDRSPDALDVFFAKVEMWLGTLQFPIDPITKQPTIGGFAGDYTRLGGDMFGTQVSYGAGWSVFNFAGPGTRISDAQGQAYGYFDASASVLGAEKSIVSANASAYSQGENELVLHRYFNVLDIYVYQPADEHQTLDWSFALDPTPRWDGTLFGASMWISVCGVPVKLSAGVAGLVELNGGLHVGVQRDHELDTIGLSVDGVLRPVAQVDGFASAAASIGVITVGIKAAVTIVRAELPLTTNVRLATDSYGQVLLTVSAKLELVLRTLDGRVSAFVDYWLDDAEVTLFEWQGLSDTTTLFSSSMTTAPMTLIKNLLDHP